MFGCSPRLHTSRACATLLLLATFVATQATTSTAGDDRSIQGWFERVAAIEPGHDLGPLAAVLTDPPVSAQSTSLVRFGDRRQCDVYSAVRGHLLGFAATERSQLRTIVRLMKDRSADPDWLSQLLDEVLQPDAALLEQAEQAIAQGLFADAAIVLDCLVTENDSSLLQQIELQHRLNAATGGYLCSAVWSQVGQIASPRMSARVASESAYEWVPAQLSHQWSAAVVDAAEWNAFRQAASFGPFADGASRVEPTVAMDGENVVISLLGLVRVYDRRTGTAVATFQEPNHEDRLRAVVDELRAERDQVVLTPELLAVVATLPSDVRRYPPRRSLRVFARAAHEQPTIHELPLPPEVSLASTIAICPGPSEQLIVATGTEDRLSLSTIGVEGGVVSLSPLQSHQIPTPIKGSMTVTWRLGGVAIQTAGFIGFFGTGCDPSRYWVRETKDDQSVATVVGRSVFVPISGNTKTAVFDLFTGRRMASFDWTQAPERIVATNPNGLFLQSDQTLVWRRWSGDSSSVLLDDLDHVAAGDRWLVASHADLLGGWSLVSVGTFEGSHPSPGSFGIADDQRSLVIASPTEVHSYSLKTATGGE